jgi:SRSO17 transposase
LKRKSLPEIAKVEREIIVIIDETGDKKKGKKRIMSRDKISET